MRSGELIPAVFFAFFVVLAWIRSLPAGKRFFITAVGMVGLALAAGASQLQGRMADEISVTIRDWLPALLLIMCYWQTGRFFVRPNLVFQNRLEAFDQAVLGSNVKEKVNQFSHRLAGKYLEFSYLFCYPMVPLGVAVLYYLEARYRIDYYWSIVLPAALGCYACTAFVHTLPPRMLDREQDDSAEPSALRALNLGILEHASIQVNTFPSGHVAASFAAALAMFRVSPTAGWLLVWIGLSISGGAVVGRYHYTIDAILGLVFAMVAFLAANLL